MGSADLEDAPTIASSPTRTPAGATQTYRVTTRP